MNAALLAYKKLAKLFQVWGFVMNPYNPCAWNKKIRKFQLSIIFHIDDLLISHRYADVVSLFIKKLEKEYSVKDPLTVTRGKLHEYLEMTVDFSVPGLCKMAQYDCIKKLWLSLPDNWKNGYKNNASPLNLFKVAEDSAELDEKKKEEYHTNTAKNLWLSQRSRPDIQFATGYHCTRVKCPNADDWDKLKYSMQYLWETRCLPLIIGMKDIDGAHAVHRDCRGQGGLIGTFGTGAMLSKSGKLGLTTTCSTET